MGQFTQHGDRPIGWLCEVLLRNFSYGAGRDWAYDICGYTKEAQSMYNHILVPVDGSETSLLGLQHAILLAKDQKAALRLLHVVHDYLLADGRHALVISGELLKDLREHGQTVLNDAASIARKQGVEAEPECVESPMGPVGAVIAKYAEQWPADLIVLGTHGRRGIRRLVMGSDAEYVVRTARVPVLLVRGTKAPPKD
ncbi:MAG: universal stress protein [Steroidobacteraceae bacterium]